MFFTKEDRTKQGLSLFVIVASGVIFALFCAAALFFVMHMGIWWTPSAHAARRLLDRGRYAEALAVAEQIQEQAPPGTHDLLLGQIWLAKAYEYHILTDWSGYGLDPDDYFKGEHADAALRHLEAAAAAHPARAEPFLYLGTLYMEKGWYGAAELALLNALRNEPDQITAQINLAAVYTMLGRHQEAESELLRAWNQQQSSDIARNLAVLYRHYLKEPQSALEWSNRYLNLDPRRDPHRLLIRRDFEEMLKRYPEYAPADEEQHWRTAEPTAPRTTLEPSR